MLGRSDGVLNPGGIRFGSSEIYDVLDFAFSKSTCAQHLLDFLAIGQKIDNGTDERVILFVKLSEDEHLSLDLESNIKAAIRERRSPRHIPSRIIQVPDIPYTLNGKRVEVILARSSMVHPFRASTQLRCRTQSAFHFMLAWVKNCGGK
jgi:acetoacetyl-CoA synthetase